MIYVGIDDTDVLDARGTNQLARALAAGVRDGYRCLRIMRHQLLDDPRIPYTSKNGSASLIFEPLGEPNLESLLHQLAEMMHADFIPGSDPGLCTTQDVPPSVKEFGRRCQRELIAQREARALAAAEGIALLGLGGTEDGVIGALAAVGLAAESNDGRVIQLGDWLDDLSSVQPLDALTARGVVVRDLDSGEVIKGGRVDLGKKLRPNWREGVCVLFVQRAGDEHGNPVFRAVRLT